jgi:dihydrofolate synthase/folylpolyglutamate synthase
MTADLSAYLERYAQRKAAFPHHPQDSPLRARRLLDLLGAPDRVLPIVRVIGTKGKGSTAAMLAAILQAAGYHVGLYTSPHLHSPRERIQVDGVPIGRPAFAAGLAALYKLLLGSLAWDDIGPATLFEGLTALAAAHFAQRGVELAIFEAGMGGRSDATHALTPTLILLTPIALDHQAYLGSTLEAIAIEKSAAIPAGGVVLSAAQPPEVRAIIAARCREVGARLQESAAGVGSGGILPGLRGPHQAVNAGLALATVEALREVGRQIPEEAVTDGLRSVHWPGRLEIVAGRPLTLVDAAHNPAAAAALATALADGQFRKGQPQELPPHPRILLLGCSVDKDLAGIAAALARVADGVVLARAHHHRAAVPEEMAPLWQAHDVPVEIVPEVRSALYRARTWAGPEGLVCACGSFFVAAEVREVLGLAVREAWPEPVGEKATRR